MSIFRNWNGEESTIENFAARALDGSDYDRGELETIRASQDKVSEALVRLLVQLREQAALSDEQVFYIVMGYKPK